MSTNKEGYLFKKSKPKAYRGITWQRRYIRMTADQILYFENAEKTKVLGSISMKEVKSAQPTDQESGRPNSFILETNDRVFTFQADNAKECAEWCAMITDKFRMVKENAPEVLQSSSIAYDADSKEGSDKEGYLFKAPKKGLKAGWRSRWCTLQKDLFYYHESFMHKTSSHEPIGTIPLSSILYLEASEEEETGRSSSFKLATTHRTYYFQAESRDSLMAWMKSFKSRMGEKVRIDSFLEQNRRKQQIESAAASLVEKSGFLKKSGPEGGRTKVRFCVLKNGILSYYEKEGAGRAMGVIILSSCYEARKSAETAFEIETENRTYYFVAETSDDRDDWVKILSSNIQHKRDRVSRYSGVSASSITKQGTIFKTGQNQGKWKRRHLVLQGDILAYFDQSEELTRPLGVIHLHECSAIKETEPELGRDFVWCLVTPSRVYKFCCESAAERESWIDTVYTGFGHIQVVRRSFDRYGEYLTRANLADLEDYISLNIIRKTGTDMQGRSVFVFCPGHVPDSADLNKVLMLLIRVMDPVVGSPYVLVFVNSVSSKQVRISWLKSSYEILPRNYKKNLQAFYILHPTKWYTVLQNSIRPFVSQKVWLKTQFINKISDLYQYIKPDQLTIPPESFVYEQQQNPQTKVFGVSLDELLMRVSFGQGSEDVPPIVEKCCNFLESTALQSEGLFRLAGNASDIQETKKQFDQGEDVIFDSSTDPHLVSSLFKSWIRELPEPLMTYELYDEWVEASDCAGKQAYLQDLKTLFDSLPPSNKMVLTKLFLFLNKISQFSTVNKMTAENLSIVFAPNILRDRQENIQQTLLDSPLVNKVVTTLIANAQFLFQ